MPYFETPLPKYDPHPVGNHRGQIVNVEDKGMVDGLYGTKHKISVQIDSETAIQEEGDPFPIWIWCTLSGSKKSKLYDLRKCLLGRDLTDEERQGFEEIELMGKRLAYSVEHAGSDDGERTFANISKFWPVVEAPPATEPVGTDTEPEEQPRVDGNDGLPF